MVFSNQVKNQIILSVFFDYPLCPSSDCVLFLQEKLQEVDPELVEDAEFYQQLLKEFFETIDPASSGIVTQTSRYH